MRQTDFEHLIAAAASASREAEIVVIGSQAILGSFPDAPEEMLFSMEADVYPRHRPERAEEIDGSLGDGSPFHRSFGFFAHGVGPETAKGPAGWEQRLVAVEIPPRPGEDRGPVAHCMEVHDLVLAKCVANRDRDWDFARVAIRAQLVDTDELRRRVPHLPIDGDQRQSLERMLEAAIAAASV